MSLYVVILIVCQHHFQSRENEPWHVLCSSCPYFEVGVARTVPNMQSCDRVLFHAITVLKIRSTLYSKWSSSLKAEQNLYDVSSCLAFMDFIRNN